MTEEELMHIPEDEGSSSEETDDETYDQLHVRANTQLKAQIAELIRLTEEKLKLKKGKTVNSEHHRDNDDEDDTVPTFTPEDF